MTKRNGTTDDQDGFAGGRDMTYFQTGAEVKKCFHDHPLLTINGGTFAGGSCLYPVHKDFDVYIGFDSGMRFSGRQYPWTAGEEFMMPITDQGVPRDYAAFTDLVTFVWERLGEGKRVHAGCIGGHGRTGLLVAALADVMGKPYPIAWTREHYCKKAVESQKQIDFLVEVWGGEKDALPQPKKKGWGGWTGPKKDGKVSPLFDGLDF